MQITTSSPLSVGGYAWRPRYGGHAYVVIIKATFELVPGIARLAAVPDGLNLSDNHWDDDTSCSVYAPSDMAPFKERADVTLVGDAYAPTPGGARTVVTRLCAAGMDKKVAVFCDRHLDDKGRVREGEPFTRMALRYERAAGGRLSDNPVGLEPATRANRAEGARRLPNVQAHETARRGRGGPAGFGPLGAEWPLRRRLLRSVAKRFQTTRWRELPLPAALDSTYFNEAPRDQRVDRIRADEAIVLENLHPRWPRLATRLPGVAPRAFVTLDGEISDVALAADTLWIDMTRSVCTVTWRGSFEIAAPDQAGRVVIGLAESADELAASEVLGEPRTEYPSSVRTNEREAERASRESDIGWISSPVGQLDQRPRMQTLDLAAGAEDLHVPAPLPFIEPSPTETLVLHPPPARATAAAANPLPSVPPPPPPSIAPPSVVAPSPWAGSLAATRHEPRPPRTEDRDSVAPPPLMLVPPLTPPPSRRAGLSTRGALPKSHRVEVLGYEAAELERVRRTWPLGADDELPGDRLDRELRAAFGTVDTIPPEKARRSLVVLLANSAASDVQGMREAMMGAVDEEGVFSAPLVLTHGVLRPSFDAVEVLRATIASVAAHQKDNAALREEIGAAREILEQRLIAPDVAEELTERIRLTFDDGIDADKIDTRIERMLLEGRAYQHKQLFEGSYVHATLAVDGELIPCYLTESLAKAIPLYAELTVRLIAELHPRQDQHETSTRALRVIALGRVVARQEEH